MPEERKTPPPDADGAIKELWVRALKAFGKVEELEERVEKATEKKFPWTEVGSLLIAGLALGFSWYTYQDSNKASEQTREQVVLAKMLDMNADLHAHIDRHPEIAKYFSRLYRDEGTTNEKLLQEFMSLSPTMKVPVWMGCEKVADYIQLVFTQREYLTASEWNSWWAYFADLHDENPVLQEFLKKREYWYNYNEEIATAKSRRDAER